METVKLLNRGKTTFKGMRDINNNKVDLSPGKDITVDLQRAVHLSNAYPRELKIIKESIQGEDNGTDWKLSCIPKICSFYWGNKEMPWLRMMSMVSFHKLNPDWETRLYIPAHYYQGDVTWKTGEQNYEVKTKDYFQYMKERYPGIKIIEFNFETIQINSDIPENFKSDFLRWHLLSTIGGLWADNDILFIRPMVEFEKNKTCYYNKGL